jgi:hypothetical protein
MAAPAVLAGALDAARLDRRRVRLDAAMKRYAESLDELERIGALPTEGLGHYPRMREAWSMSRPSPDLEIVLELMEEHGWPSFYSAALLAGLGASDQAFARLERASAGRDWYLMRVAVSPHMDPLRDDPRFPRLLKRLGLDRVPSPPMADATP